MPAIDLSRQKQQSIEEWTQNPHLTLPEMAEKIGVSTRTLNRWRTDPEYVYELSRRAKTSLNAHLPALYDVAVREALKGDWKFMKIVLDHINHLVLLENKVNDNVYVIQWNSSTNISPEVAIGGDQ